MLTGRAGRLRWRSEQGGQAMIEMALLLPFVFLLILMILELGFLLWTNLNVSAAAREAARYAAVGREVGEDANCETEADTIKGRAFAAAVGRIACSDVAVFYIERPERSGSPEIRRGDGVIVEIDHPYDSLTGFFRLINVTTPINVHACADARVETPPDPTDASGHVDNAAACA